MLKVWLSGGLGSVRSTVGINDHKGPLQLEQFYVSSHLCPGARITNVHKMQYNKSLSKHKKKTFSWWGWSVTEINSPQGLYCLHSWRYSNPDSIWPWAACFRWPCFEQGIGLDDSWRCLPNWLCNSVKIKSSHGIRDFGGGWLDIFQCKEFSCWMVSQFWELNELDHCTRIKVASTMMCWVAVVELRKCFRNISPLTLQAATAPQCSCNFQQAVSTLP